MTNTTSRFKSLAAQQTECDIRETWEVLPVLYCCATCKETAAAVAWKQLLFGNLKNISAIYELSHCGILVAITSQRLI